MAFKRLRNTVALAKIESTEGTDASPVGTDAVKIENCKIQYTANLIKTNEYSGSLDTSVPIVGSVRPQITFDYWIKGNGAPGTTAPEWGRLLKACGWTESLLASAVGVPTAITAGTATSATLAAAFTGADQAYRGMPLLISGTPAAALSGISDWIQSTKVATLTDTFGTALTTSALTQIPANALYTPGSSSIPSLTFYIYEDGLLYIFLGARGTVKFAMDAGGALKASFSFMAMFGSETDASNPTPTYDAVQKPIWKNTGLGTAGQVGGAAAFTIGQVAAALKSFTLDCGNQMLNPDDPNAAEAFDPAQIISRDITGTMDPYQTSIATRDLMTDFRGNTPRCLHARLGSTAGNRIMLTVPNALYTDAQPGDNGGLTNRAMKFDAKGTDGAGAQLCVF